MEKLVAAFSLQLPGSEWEIGSEEHSPQVEAQSNVAKCGEEGCSRTCGEMAVTLIIVSSRHGIYYEYLFMSHTESIMCIFCIPIILQYALPSSKLTTRS